jgi:RNA polymerase primary sigma factor
MTTFSRTRAMEAQKIQSEAADPGFAAYMRDVARYPVLTPPQERDLGVELMALRSNYWRQVLSYAPFSAAALDVVFTHLEVTPALEAAASALRDAARSARDTNRKAAVDRFNEVLADVAGRLAAIDTECIGADRIAADVEQLAAGGHVGLSMQVRPPRQGSQPFSDYVLRVRRAAAALRAARNRFARANLRLVVRIASRFQRSGLSLHDRVQEGNLGLMKAVDRFDPSRGFRFSTYASWWIKHAIRRAVANRDRTVRLPAHLQSTWSRVNQARVVLRARNAREPEPQEIADEIGVPLTKVEACIEAMAQHQVSLHARVSDEDDRSVADMLADPEEIAADEILVHEAETGRVLGQLMELTPMEQDILRQRFGLDGGAPRTLSEIGEQYALSRERIRQLQQKALQELRARME